MRLTTFTVQIELIEPILGTVPKNPDVYADYIATKCKERPGERQPLDADIEEEVNQERRREDLERSGWTGFHQDDQGLYLYDYQVLGHLKEAGNTLKDQIGIRNLRSKIDQFVYIFPRRIHFAKTPSGVLERPLRAMTAQGPRVSLVRSDIVPEGTRMEFEIRLLANKEITGETLREILEFGGLTGLGQWRKGGWGRFRVISFEQDGKA